SDRRFSANLERAPLHESAANAPIPHLAEQFQIVIDGHRRESLSATRFAELLYVVRRDRGDRFRSKSDAPKKLEGADLVESILIVSWSHELTAPPDLPRLRERIKRHSFLRQRRRCFLSKGSRANCRADTLRLR